jgi:hypothetical protein
VNPIAEHLLRTIPTEPPKRISQWAAELAPVFGVSEPTVVAVINRYLDRRWLMKRGNQHKTAPHTLRLSQQGYTERAALLLNDRKAQD